MVNDKSKVSQQDMEIHKLSQDFKIRNKILSKLIWILYGRRIKLHNRTEEDIWRIMLGMDCEEGLLQDNNSRRSKMREVCGRVEQRCKEETIESIESLKNKRMTELHDLPDDYTMGDFRIRENECWTFYERIKKLYAKEVENEN